MTKAVYHRDLIDRFVGREVIWHDEDNYSRGPGTVIGVTKDNKLRIIEHETLVYRTKWAIIDQVEVIKFSDEQYETLPQILRDEIVWATSVGTYCDSLAECTNHRVFGGQFCADHEPQDEPEYDPHYEWEPSR